MTNRMQDAVDYLMAIFKAVCPVTVTYTRGSSIAIEDLTVTVGRTPYDIIDGDAMVTHESRDYFIEKTDLVNGETQLYPQSGDIIEEEDGRKYEVSCPKGDNVFESLGPEGTVFKVHTIDRNT